MCIRDRDTGSPVMGQFDQEVSLEETWAAMEGLIDEGLVRHIGVSNFGQGILSELLGFANIVPYCNQVETHPFLVQPGLVDFCREQGIKVVAYHPIGKPSKREPDNNCLEHPVVRALASKHKSTPAQVVLKWQLQRGVTVIPKSCTESRIQENIQLSGFCLDSEEMTEMSLLDRNQHFCKPGFPWTDELWERVVG
eukprot:TRINITY_DN5238_c0_g1_i1.p1 TRINITY_DN5238_c0_g1~~TRINITY_DN5238_c0_g1_i1.p1  ORF type:complete len:195 (-),score=46.79 TRINITY_DN5238_c0_g1_i1:196-780(-)